MGWHALKLLIILPYILKTMYYARKCVKSVEKNPLNAKKKADEKFLEELETQARNLGISAIGYTEVPRQYIFRNSVLLFKNAIVLTMDMDKEKIKKAPGIAAAIEVWRTYAELAKAVYKLSEFMRKRDATLSLTPDRWEHALLLPRTKSWPRLYWKARPFDFREKRPSPEDCSHIHGHGTPLYGL